MDRAGLVGADGPTHHGAYDIAYMRTIPNLIVSAPMNEVELRNLMYTAQLPEMNHPISIRYPRGQGVLVDWELPFEKIPIGKGRRIVKGEDVALLTIGHAGNYALQAIDMLESKGIYPALYDMRFVKPLDEELLHQILSQFRKIITVEDGALMGGFGSAILEFMADHDYHKVTVKRLGIPDRVVDHGEPSQLYKECEFDAAAIAKTVIDTIEIVYT
jgi:1-deoxy-D-xylulose-5-phosphate synthase